MPRRANPLPETHHLKLASSVLDPATENQRLTTIGVVTIRATFVLHGGETAVRLPSVVSKPRSM